MLYVAEFLRNALSALNTAVLTIIALGIHTRQMKGHNIKLTYLFFSNFQNWTSPLRLVPGSEAKATSISTSCTMSA